MTSRNHHNPIAPPHPVSVPASKCDRPGQADAAVAEAVIDVAIDAWCKSLGVPDMHYRARRQAMRAAVEAALRATAPGRKNGESDAAFVERVAHQSAEMARNSIRNGDVRVSATVMEKLCAIALARTPARTDGGVSNAEVEAGARAWCKNHELDPEWNYDPKGVSSAAGAQLRWRSVAPLVREIIEAARATETAGGAGETL